MNEAELSNWLASKLKMSGDSKRFKPLWKYLVDKHYVDEVLDNLDSPEGLLENARQQLRLAYEITPSTMPPGRTRREGPIDVALTKYEKQCSIVLSEYLAKQASLLPDVRQFRDEVLEGTALPPEKPEEEVNLLLREVREFLENQLYHYICDPRGGGMGIDPQFYPEYLIDLEEMKDLVGGVVEPLYEEEETAVYPRASAASGEGLDLYIGASNYEYPYERGVMELIKDKEGESLGDLSRRLASIYPWRPQDGAWFVLTNESPDVLLPLTLHKNSRHGLYTMAFARWISEETFKRVYRAVQDGDNRSLKVKTLAAFQFVTHHTDSDGNKPSWNELLRLWNEKCRQFPAYRFTQRDGLYRAYKRAEQELAAPWLDVPKNMTAKEEVDTSEGSVSDIPF